ncbi:MAG: hypothetical protein ACOYEV_13450 [Candidatus Nanopelagicales bacterium]
MWLISQEAGSGRTTVNEVHPVSRLMHTPTGLEYLTPPGRVLLGVAFYLADLVLPSPDDVARRCAEQLVRPDIARTVRWRWERISRQLPRARERKARWAEFALRNDLGEKERELVGVALTTGGRAVLDATTGATLAPAASRVFWLANPYLSFADALNSDRGGPDQSR